MIPKKIHFCWFSGQPIPEEYLGYMESWKKYCPDYEIIRWDETNYDIHKNRYMEEAYRNQRWGFVPDYARLDIIYREGGIYLDTDVELLRSLDAFLDNPAFFGFENDTTIGTGIGFGAEAGNPILGRFLERYETLRFQNPDGTLNLTPSPAYVSEWFQDLGAVRKSSLQRLQGVTLYPKDYFCPMDYNTGQLHRTEHSCSIHHFSCSWMTREEKEQEARRRRWCGIYGDWLGNRLNGVEQRIRKGGTVQAGWVRERLLAHSVASDIQRERRLTRLERAGAVLLSPGAKSGNLGDAIIEQACVRQVQQEQPFTWVRVSTHTYPTWPEEQRMKQAKVVLVAGSNLLSGDLRHGQWKLAGDYRALEHLCLMGCGWSRYEPMDSFSRRLYAQLLRNGWLHSVRDRYTEQKLRNEGIDTVIYTGCPVMWSLTPERCGHISARKKDVVVTSLTANQMDRRRDRQQLRILLREYDAVYFWPQGSGDSAYLRTLLSERERAGIRELPRNLMSYRTMLDTFLPDYVGSRLHGGLYAMQRGCRSLILSLDNRAWEIGKDTNLPVLPRIEIEEKLSAWIRNPESVELSLPWENIRIWKEALEARLR